MIILFFLLHYAEASFNRLRFQLWEQKTLKREKFLALGKIWIPTLSCFTRAHAVSTIVLKVFLVLLPRAAGEKMQILVRKG